MNLLIVDDEPEYRMLAGNFFRDLKWTVFLAGNGKEAMDILYKESIDFIVSDVYMPLMDGIKFHKTVRSVEKFAQIPFLFVSAFDDRYTLNAVKDASKEGFVRKGRPLEDLKRWIDYLLTPADKRSPFPPGEGKSTSSDWRRDASRTRRR
jgi:CheY-like chemotaxis protein